MSVTKITLKPSERDQNVMVAYYEGVEYDNALGRARTAGTLCRFYEVPGGVVVVDPVTRNPVWVLDRFQSIENYLRGQHPKAEINTP